MNKLLLHPHITLAATIAGIASAGALCTAVVANIAPLQIVPGLESIRPALGHIIIVLGVISAVCTALAGIGRSFISAIDNPNNSAPKQAPPPAG